MAERTIEEVANSIRQATPRQLARAGLVGLAILFVEWLAYSALVVVLLFALIDFTENYVLIPRIIGHSVGAHPVILMMAIVAFGHTLELIGVVLAAPITAILRDLFLYAYRRPGGSSPGEVMKSLRA